MEAKGLNYSIESTWGVFDLRSKFWGVYFIFHANIDVVSFIVNKYILF